MFPNLQDWTRPVLPGIPGLHFRLQRCCYRNRLYLWWWERGDGTCPCCSLAQTVAAAAATVPVRVPHLPLTVSILLVPVPHVVAGTASSSSWGLSGLSLPNPPLPFPILSLSLAQVIHRPGPSLAPLALPQAHRRLWRGWCWAEQLLREKGASCKSKNIGKIRGGGREGGLLF